MDNLKKTPDIKTALRLLKQHGLPVIITRHGEPAAAVIPLDLFALFIEHVPLKVVNSSEEYSYEEDGSIP